LALTWVKGGQPGGGWVGFGLALNWAKGGQPRGGLVWFDAYLGLTMVAAHMKKASPEARRRKREASQGKVPAGAAAAPALVSSVQMIRPRLA